MSSTGTNRRSFLIRSVFACGGLAGGAGLLAGCAADREPELAAPPPGLYEDPPVPVFAEDVLVGEYLEVNGARIFYQVLGAGEPMLLLHGYPLSGALFARNRDVLAERYRVITVDHRGYGKSQVPAVPRPTAPKLDRMLHQRLDSSRPCRLILDLSELHFLGSHGITVLIRLLNWLRAPTREARRRLVRSTARRRVL
jgi:hypothetical protein